MEKHNEDWLNSENNNLEKALFYLGKYEEDIKNVLADCVASVCNIKKEEMMEGTHTAYLAQARWLFWYSYRYMTNETYEKIAKQTSTPIHKFSTSSVRDCVNKMGMMIASEHLWQRRWNIIKNIIKQRCKEKEEKVIVINIPKELKDQVRVETKEKI